MDSLSQAVFGATIAGVVAPPGHRRKALFLGAALGTLPDLDVLIDYGDAVKNFTYHRGFTHSLFVLPGVAVVIWLALMRIMQPPPETRARWFAAIALALVTHPLLDAHTAYGTQLFWPLSVSPTMWGTLFIIDPLFTLPLLVGSVALGVWPNRARGIRIARLGLSFSVLYIGWSWVAQSLVEHNVRAELAREGHTEVELFLTPAPFNTLLWRAVARTDQGFFETYDSLVVDEDRLQFARIPSDVEALEAAATVWSVARLRWFASDFVSAEVRGDNLVIHDLRMGSHPDWVFSHVAAVQEDGTWRETPTELLPFSFEDRALTELWHRIWGVQDY